MKDVDAFKNELRNYSYYQQNLKGTRKLIAYNEYLLSNVKGLDPSKEAGGSPAVWVESEQFKRISDELGRLNRHRELREAQIAHIETVMNRLSPEVRKACVEIYVNGKTYHEIAAERFVSMSGLYKQIDKELTIILKK